LNQTSATLVIITKAKFFGLDERTSASGRRGARDRDISSRDIQN
jgi:hypothetical protein